MCYCYFGKSPVIALCSHKNINTSVPLLMTCICIFCHYAGRTCDSNNTAPAPEIILPAISGHKLHREPLMARNLVGQ